MYGIKRACRKLAILALFSLLPLRDLLASASCPRGTICNPIPEVTSIAGFIQTLLEGALRLGIPIVALAIIYCGFLFVAARGNSEKLNKAKEALMYTLIGGGVLIGSWAIAELITNTVSSIA